MQKLGVPASHADSYLRAMDLNGDGQSPRARACMRASVCILDCASVHGCVLMRRPGTALLFSQFVLRTAGVIVLACIWAFASVLGCSCLDAHVMIRHALFSHCVLGYGLGYGRRDHRPRVHAWFSSHEPRCAPRAPIPPGAPLLHLSPVRHQQRWVFAVQYSTVQYSTVQYSTVQYSTVQYSTVQCSAWLSHGGVALASFLATVHWTQASHRTQS
jgi:hypothetical protein